MLNEINWPEGYLPGFTDNFASNEVIVRGLTATEVFAFLVKAGLWASYYANSSDVEIEGEGAKDLVLRPGARFRFKTFGFPIEAKVIEFEAPSAGRPGRLAWHGWAEGDAAHRLDVVHAWLIEDLPQGRVRILTQESQKGEPAKQLHETNPDTMNIGHQDWLKGLVAALKKQKNG
jgi:hypothetical protein